MYNLLDLSLITYMKHVFFLSHEAEFDAKPKLTSALQLLNSDTETENEGRL
jgi:hypothetical protein